MELTKKECERALVSLREIVMDHSADGYIQPRFLGDYYCGECDVIKHLITEHFDNPPLEFEELHEGMWVWDNEYKLYCIIQNVYHNKNLCVRFKTSFADEELKIMQTMDHFEENRFYAREVKKIEEK